MKLLKQNRLVLMPLAAALMLATGVWAAPPATSPYATDGANEYVQDATSDGISNVNMVLCIMHAMSPSDMLTSKGVLNSTTGITEVQYRALVDKNKCDTKSRSDASNSSGGASGSTATPSYMTAIVDVSRGSGATDPMIGKVWMQLTENGGSTVVSIKFTATTAPSATQPYGVLRLDYVGYQGSTLGFNGYIDANGAAVNYLETGGNSSNVALALNAQDTTSGSGIIQSAQNNGGTPTTVTYTFAYNPVAFDRNSGGGAADVCFDRSKANAEKSVWRYGIYDATTGDRIDQAHPGFPISGTTNGITGVANGQTLYGYASYWGINFGGVDQSVIGALPDGQVTVVSNITDQRTGNSTAYNLYKASGKLTSWTRNSTTLAALDGIPFNHFGEGCTLVNGGNGVAAGTTSPSGASCATTASDFQNWVMQWDSALVVTRNGIPSTGNFKVTGMQGCSQNGCLLTVFNAAAPVQQGFMYEPIEGYSDALGGDLTIPLPPGDTPTSGTTLHGGTDTVYYYVQSTVLPGASSLSLWCLSNCPTAASLSSYTAGSTTTPFVAPTDMQFGSGAAEVTYAFNGSGLVDGTSTPVALTSVPSNSQWQNGLQTGRLYTSDLAVSGSNPCPNAPGQNTPAAYCEPAGPAVYYTYSTGPNQWNQTTWLTAGGTPVPFDPPQNIAFTVPSDSTFVALYGSAWAGKPIQLQFNGFGNLYGIPGNCVDPQTNLPAACSPSARYVPAFALLDGTGMTLGTTAVLVRALDDELRLRKIPCSGTGLSTAGVSVTLPTALPHNPTLVSDTGYYIGTAPTVTGAPAVIDGVLQ